ncbi:efflux transporter outer membrane subunit [Dyella subtropica]|uniref:efflux transporter outer membrane subunit n=1 Tax=Dyella subtropica TaxID=2992127 RepID=UPI002252EDC8|nr:efflux transporter outer membrane subunit [Dyella subtropica]
MRLHTMAAAIGLSLALAGCVSSGGLHPSGALTDASSLKSERSLNGIAVSPAAWPQQDWWTALGDAQLSGLIDEALRDNPGLAAADARAQQAQAAAGVADAERGPTVNAGASVAGARPPGALFGGHSHFSWAKYGYASFNWGLDLWGGKRAAWEAALGQARAAEIDRQAARIELSTNVGRAYTQLGYAYAQQDVAKAELERANRARDLTRQRASAGIDSQLQLKQSDTEVATAEQQQAVANRAIDAARSSLSVLLGKGPDRGLDITRPQVLKPVALAVPGNLSMDLIGHRADLVAARWRVEAASKDIKVAKTEFLPNVSIGAMAGLLNMGGGNLFSLKNRFYELGPSLSLPIFDGGRLRANLAGKDAQYDLAVAQYNETLVAATNQVADNYNALQSMQQQIDAQQRALDAATEAWQLSEQRYKAGIGNYLEALIVRQQLLQAQQRMAALQSQQVDLSVQLIQALGGGYRPQADDAHEVAAASSSSVSERSL